MFFGHRSGHQIDTGFRPFHIHYKIRFCILLSMGHDFLMNHQGSAFFHGRRSHSFRRVNAFDLYRLHFQRSAFGKMNLGGGVHDPLPVAVAGTIMLFHIPDFGIFVHKEPVNPGMFRRL